jgi:hypothetical protein
VAKPASPKERYHRGRFLVTRQIDPSATAI